MFRKISNYFAVFSLSLVVFGGSVLANPVVSTEKNEAVRVDENKDFNFYNGFILSGKKRSYTVKVEAGKEVRVRFNGSGPVALSVKTPDGETKSYSQDRFFEVTLRGTGEYVLEFDSTFISQYSLKVFNQ